MRILFLLMFLAIGMHFSFAQTADVTEGCFPLTVRFNAPAGSTTYYWNFQDQVTSDKMDPINIFSKPGTYNVTFQESINGPIIKTIPIKVFEAPVLAMKVMSGCAPLNAQFTNQSVIDPGIKINKYVWVFGDGQRVENVQSPSHLYTSPSFYDVSLSIEADNSTCNSTVIFSKAHEVIQSPVALFSTNPSGSSCDDKADFTFVSQSTGVKPLTYAWNFGNSKTSSVQSPGVQNYISGQFNTSLTVSYTDIPGCSSTTSKTISVGSPKPDIITKDTSCLSQVVSVKTTVPGFHSWKFGPGASANNTTGDSALVVFSTSGIHTISLNLTSFDGKCSGSITKDIFLQDLDLKIESDPSFSCKNPTIVKYKAISSVKDLTYIWTFNDGTKGTDANVEKLYWTNTDSLYYDRNIREVKTVLLKVTSKSSQCSVEKMTTDTLWLPNAIFSPSVTMGCAPLFTTFSDSSLSSPINPIVRWQWIMGDGNIITKVDGKPITYTYSTPGKYLARLLITTQKGCTDTSFAVLVQVGTNVTQQINFTASKTEVCLNEPLNFTAEIPVSLSDKISAYHFSTEGNMMSHCFADKQASWAYTQEVGAQDVSLSVDYNGCISTIHKNNFVNVKGAVAKIAFASLCNKPLDYTFTSTGGNATKLTWLISNGASETSPSWKYTFPGTGDFIVSLKAEDPASGCASTSDEVTVFPRILKAAISIDSLLCINSSYNFSAQGSVGVDAKCYTGYTWQFPQMNKRPYTSDRSISNFSFDKAGVHQVLLIVKDINGCRDTASKSFKVYKMDLKAVTDDPDKKICTPALVNFTDQSVGDTTLAKWLWKFDDNTTSSERNPKHNFLIPPSSKGSSYDIKLVVTDYLGCKDSLKVPLQFYKPLSNITATPSPNLCLGKSVTLKAADYTATGSKLSYTWDFGNGKKDSIQENTLVYDSARNYTVKLSYKEVGSNCKGDTTKIISIQDYPKAGIVTNVDSLPVLCAPQNVFFKDGSQSNYPLTSFWNFGNGQTSTVKDYSLFYAKGTYKATYIVRTSYGCADTASRSFRVYRPEGNFTMDKDIICKGDVISFTLRDTVDVGSFTWAFGDGNTSSNIAPISHAYNFHPPSGQTLAKLVLRGVQGICPIEVNKPINIRRVIADFERNNGGDTSICFNDGPYPLKDKSTAIQNYFWNFGDGQTSTVPNPGIHAYAKPGLYKVTLSGSENTNGCKDTIVKQIVIHKNPTLIASADTVCQGKTIQMNVINPDTTSLYRWTPANGLSNPAIFNPIANIQQTIFYKLEQTDTNGCKDLNDVAAVVIEPIGLQDWDTTMIIGDSARLPVFGQSVYKFQWTPESWLSCVDCNYPWARPFVDTTYQLKVTDVRNCFAADYYFKIHIKPETFVRLPTTFTPNDDHTNDSVYVQGWGIKKLVEFQIFNRWGQMIFASNDMRLGWDGRYNGVLQNSDVYVYKVKVLTWREELLYNEGYINLVH